MEYKYVDHKFAPASETMLDRINEVIKDYSAQGHRLTLRQIYYQMVVRNYIPNKEQSYKNLGSLINDGRLAGRIDWNALEDRTRNLEGEESGFESTESFVKNISYWYGMSRWRDQDVQPEVWVEKNALVNVIARPAGKYFVPYLACVGYPSLTEIKLAADRIMERLRRKQKTLILHLGDHDPSGIDMTRDIRDRLSILNCIPEEVEIRRIALNMSQIEEFSPPPNPAKITDPRARSYFDLYGNESWELDALQPSTLEELIGEHIEAVRDDKKWAESEAKEEAGKLQLSMIAHFWNGPVEDGIGRSEYYQPNGPFFKLAKRYKEQIGEEPNNVQLRRVIAYALKEEYMFPFEKVLEDAIHAVCDGSA